MRVVSHAEANEELEAAALWYEEQQPGLGDVFLNEFERTLRRIVADPEFGVTIASSTFTVFLTQSFIVCIPMRLY